MASNYSSDPNNAASLSNPATPQSGPGGNAPEFPLPAVNPQSTPRSDGDGRGNSSSNGRRLQPGIELSYGRYKIERSVAAGGMGPAYPRVDQPFHRPFAAQ